MDVAKWDDSYKTGHSLVDAQHQELFRLVNDLHFAIVHERGKEVLMPTLEKLANYTVQHFQTEEKLMDNVKYPELAAHKQKHAELAKEVTNMIEKYRSGESVLTIVLSNFLAKWLRHHIKEDDMALVKFLKQKNAVAASAKA